jgi:RNA recognition motif-containing protein
MTGKPKGFSFLMYEDQRSTILAVDNLNGAKVLDRTLRVDHVKHYRQGQRGENGEWIEAEEQSFNAKPEMIMGMAPRIICQCSSSLTCLDRRRRCVRIVSLFWDLYRSRRSYARIPPRSTS